MTIANNIINVQATTIDETPVTINVEMTAVYGITIMVIHNSADLIISNSHTMTVSDDERHVMTMMAAASLRVAYGSRMMTTISIDTATLNDNPIACSHHESGVSGSRKTPRVHIDERTVIDPLNTNNSRSSNVCRDHRAATLIRMVAPGVINARSTMDGSTIRNRSVTVVVLAMDTVAMTVFCRGV
jgi:hypothetical protein